MKRRLLVFIYVQFAAQLSLSQSFDSLKKYYPKPKISAYELFLGGSMFSILGDKPKPVSPTGSGFGYFVSSLETNKSFSVVVSASRQINNHLEVKALLSYALKSYIEKSDSIRLTPDYRLESTTFLRSDQPSNQYITLQILPQYIVGRKYKFNFGLGGYLSKLLASQTEVVQASKFNYTYNSSQAFNTLDYGLSLNFGVSHPIVPALEISVQLFASQGISNISDYFLSFNYPRWYYRSYSLVIGIRFLKNKQLKL